MRARLGLPALTITLTLLASAMLVGPFSPARPADAALQEGDFRPQVIVGRDDDNFANPIIDADPGAGQNMQNADILAGAGANDVLIGRLGNDLLLAGLGDDILIGGPDSPPPGSDKILDLLFGEGGNDVAIWSPIDGAEAFVGGPGRDALVIGQLDLDPAKERTPSLTGRARGFPRGIPTADVKGISGATCAVERVPDDATLGYEFLVRYIEPETGRIRATIRLTEVEQVFCPGPRSVHGLGQILYADLTADQPGFVPVSPSSIQPINPLVSAIVR
jgi:hypothetical protein